MSLQNAMTLAAAPWADLNGELLVSIAAADNVSLRDYKCLRGVCAAWRSALKPPYPCLLSLAAGKDWQYWRSAWPSASVLSLPMQRSSRLQTASSSPLLDRHPSRSSPMFIPSSDGSYSSRPLRLVRRPPSIVYPGPARIIGSSNGRFAVAVDDHRRTKSDGFNTTMRIFVLNTGAGKEVQLDPPPTAPYDYKSGSYHMYVQKLVCAPSPDDLTVVALYDHKNVAYMDITAGSSRKWTNINVLPSSPEYKLLIADLAFHNNDGKLYCLDSCGGAYMVSIPRGGRNCEDDEHAVVEPNCQYEHAVVEPIVCKCNPNPLAAFAPPYDRVSELTETNKHLFFCNGGMYQMWRNRGTAVTLRDTRFRMAANQIFVLRYNPQCWPCWEAVRDLGDCSVFIGKNSNPAVVRPVAGGGQPWVKPNCVYWIDWMGVPMVCDIATGTSNPCVLPDGVCKGNCWYFDTDIQGDI